MNHEVIRLRPEAYGTKGQDVLGSQARISSTNGHELTRISLVVHGSPLPHAILQCNRIFRVSTKRIEVSHRLFFGAVLDSITKEIAFIVFWLVVSLFVELHFGIGCLHLAKDPYTTPNPLYFCKFGKTIKLMGTVELKSSLLRILEKIEDEELLRTVYDFLKQSQNPEVGKIWESLSEDQRKEVYQSYKDSEDDDNLTSWNDVKKKY